MKPIRLLIALALIAGLVLAIEPVPEARAATDLIVDASTGTIDFGDACPSPTDSATYKSLQAAINCAVSGDTITVHDGTYAVTGQTGCNGYNAAIVIQDLDDLTIQAAPGHEPKIQPVTAVEAYIVSISITNSDRLTIDNIDSDQTIAQWDNWHVCDSEDLTVRNSTFEGGEDGIDFETSHTTALIEGNTFINISTGSGDEVLDFTDGSFSDVIIQDNVFQNNYRQITVYPPSGHTASGFIVRRNVMDGTNSQEAVRFIGASDMTLENNVIMHSTQQGLYIDSGCSNINVWHNSFFDNGEEEIRTKVSGADIVIQNNIIYANGTSAAISASTASLPGEDFNLIYNHGTATESSSQGPVTTFGPNTTFGDPLFVSTAAGAEDLHLQSGSPAIEAGTDLGVNDDIEKGNRPNPPGTFPDMGAYEFFEPPGSITINKVTEPEGGEDFHFESDTLGSFDLDDGEAIEFELTGDYAGDYTVTEFVPEGWNLARVECTDQVEYVVNGVTINLKAGDDVTCTFFNSEEPTAITLASFTAQAGAGSVTLGWETGTEIDNAGFNLYRAITPGGPYAKVNGALIAAEGDPVAGATYSFLDENLAPGTYYYKLEDVDLNGVTTRHGPVSATVSPGLRRPAYRPTLPEF